MISTRNLLRTLILMLVASTQLTSEAGGMTFVVTNTNDASPGSLRQAILDANANPGSDVIEFNIPGPPPHTIQPLSELPVVFDGVLIDGRTQPGFVPLTPSATPGRIAVRETLVIELDGSLAGPDAFGLVVFFGSPSTVRGLVINRFAQTNVFSAGLVVLGDRGMHFTPGYPISCGRLIRLRVRVGPSLNR